jgi:hypothetical protein
MKDYWLALIALVALSAAPWIVVHYLNRDMAQRVCRVEAMNQNATVIVKLDQPQPCDPASMAIEARAAVKAALEAE